MHTGAHKHTKSLEPSLQFNWENKILSRNKQATKDRCSLFQHIALKKVLYQETLPKKPSHRKEEGM